MLGRGWSLRGCGHTTPLCPRLDLGEGGWDLSAPWSAQVAKAFLAAFAGLDDHVGKLLHFGCPADIIEDGEGLEVLRDTAGGGRCLWVQSVVKAQQRAVRGVGAA